MSSLSVKKDLSHYDHTQRLSMMMYIDIDFKIMCLTNKLDDYIFPVSKKNIVKKTQRMIGRIFNSITAKLETVISQVVDYDRYF